jgi:hypothetical protein
MSNTYIKMGGDVEDTYIKNGQEWMCKIVDAAHKFDTVLIGMSEGPALEELNYQGKKFLQILKELCESNGWNQHKFQFTLPNLVQDQNVWPNTKFSGSSTQSTNIEDNLFLHTQLVTHDIEKIFKYTFGTFVVRSSWDRLLISSFLYANYKDKTFQTYCRSLENPGHMLHMDLDKLLHLKSCDKKIDAILLGQISNFISVLPIEKTKEPPISSRIAGNKSGHEFPWVEGPVNAEILSWYNNIFVDVVCEKMITGQTFFPTEKTARPLATKTPFLMMAAPNYIKNLRKLGFRSFGQFWDEGYDYQQGVQRAESIQCIMDDLAKLDSKQLKDMYQRMGPILEHNYKTYMELTPKKILSTFN